ncbi:MAG: site-specific DNA-methyltransferase [Phycisphaera sp.]|nr:MAG: site-specific DNA-methyltransferase [Phycisphaera sp.]
MSLSERTPQQTHSRTIRITKKYSNSADCTLYNGDCLNLLKSIPSGAARLVVTSPPYNIGKEYEKKLDIEQYVDQQRQVIEESLRVLAEDGSICWQVGNYVESGEIIPLDTMLYPIFRDLGLKMRNRIVWHFEHGLHCSRRFSGRYEVIAWYTRDTKHYFDLDPVRVPQKYPGKKCYKGPRAGEYSGNPLGKNPSDVWVIPNVKHNHVEKTDHPCQFPVELVERLVLSMTETGDLVVDPFMGVGSTAVAAIRNHRRAAGADTVEDYLAIAKDRVVSAWDGSLRVRTRGKAVYEPKPTDKVAQRPGALGTSR